MFKRIIQFAAAHLLAISLVLVLANAAGAQGVITVPNNDPELAAAIAKARAGISTFWTAYEKPAEGMENFNLKVAIRDGKDVEHIWLGDITRTDGKLEGTIGNAPEIVSNVEAGQRYTFTDADVSDWMFIRNGKIVGNETMRPLLKRLPKAQAAEYRAMLETP